MEKLKSTHVKAIKEAQIQSNESNRRMKEEYESKIQKMNVEYQQQIQDLESKYDQTKKSHEG